MIRAARWFDLVWVWRLRNAPDVRRWSKNTGPIPFLAHLRWWFSRQRGQVWIAQDVRRVGYVRLSAGFVSVAVASWARGRGVGERLLALPALARTQAIIHYDNEPSRRLFWRSGYHCIGREGSFYLYQR